MSGEADRAATRHWLAEQARRQAGWARSIVGCGVASAVLALVQAVCAATALASALAGQTQVAALAGFVLAAVGRAALGYVSERLSFAAGAAARRRLRTDALDRLLQAPAGAGTGALAATVVDRIEALEGFFARYLPAQALALMVPPLMLVPILWADWVAGLAVLGALLLVPLGMALAGLGAAAASRRQFQALDRLQGRFLDRLRGLAVIVLHGREEAEARSLGEAARELSARTLRVLRVAFLSSAMLDLALVLSVALLALRFGWMLADGRMDDPFPAILALLLVAEVFAPLRAYAAAYQDRLAAHGAAAALAGLPPQMPQATPGPPRAVAAHGVTVVFDGVTVVRDPARGPVLEQLSFRAGPGDVLVLAGPSGSGKSTVLAVLLGFVVPDAGRVTINGADIAGLMPAALRALSCWIGQRPHIFAGTIASNIRFARPEASDAELAAAAEQARVTEFAADLPEGLQTRVGEGGFGLSGGQAQRVAIARAFLRNAPLLLLDEPTAHLDPGTEGAVIEALRRLAVGRTVILASHSQAAHAFAGRRVDLLPARKAA